MKGFKDSTKTQYAMGGSCYAKGGAVKGAAKVAKVMGEFKSGKLHSGSKTGPEVTNPKQATAIALSEARKAGAKIPLKRGHGGDATLADLNRANSDVGGMSKAGAAAMGKTVARGNRMQAEEAGESAIMKQRAPTDDFRKKHGIEIEKTTVKRIPASEMNTDRERAMLALRRIPGSEMNTARERALRGKPTYTDVPLIDNAINAVRRATGLKKGGLAVMPKGKGKC